MPAPDNGAYDVSLTANFAADWLSDYSLTENLEYLIY